MWWSPAAEVTGDLTEFSLGENSRMFLSTSPTIDANAYFKPNLLGGYVEFDTNISQKGCSCIAALYTVLMPGKLPDGSLNNVEHWYCDGN